VVLIEKKEVPFCAEDLSFCAAGKSEPIKFLMLDFIGQEDSRMQKIASMAKKEVHLHDF